MRQAQSDEPSWWENLPQPLHFDARQAGDALSAGASLQRLPVFRGFAQRLTRLEFEFGRATDDTAIVNRPSLPNT